MSLALQLHVLTAAMVVAGGMLAGAWGLVRAGHLRLGGNGRCDRLFTQVVALSQTAVFACGALGLMLLAGPASAPDDPLHARVYGPFMVVAVVAAWSFRSGHPRNDVRVFAVAGLIVAALGVRAFFTG